MTTLHFTLDADEHELIVLASAVKKELEYVERMIKEATNSNDTARFDYCVNSKVILTKHIKAIESHYNVLKNIKRGW